jgi:MFS family permease
MMGHLYGGILMAAFDSWRLLFWLNVPIGLLALGATWWALRDVPIQRARGSFDWLGALLVGGGLVALNLGLGAGAELGGQTDFYGERQGIPPYAAPLVVAALVLLVAFVLAERRVRDPLLDLNLFRQRGVTSACIVNVLMGFALAMALSNVPLFITTRLGLAEPANPDILRRAAWDAGWMLSALTLTMAAAAVPGGWLTNRAGARVPLISGLLLALAGFLAMSTWQATTGYPLMAVQLIVAGVGLGFVISPVATVVINAGGDERHGSASALVITLRMLGLTVGWSVLTLWGVQRQDMLRRAGADSPLAQNDPAQFLMNIAAQVIGETFLFAAAACAIALLLAWRVSRSSQQKAS